MCSYWRNPLPALIRESPASCSHFKGRWIARIWKVKIAIFMATTSVGALFLARFSSGQKKFPEEWNVVYLRACASASSTFGQFHEICSGAELVWVSSCSSCLSGYLPRPCAPPRPPLSSAFFLFFFVLLHRRSASLLVCVPFAPPSLKVAASATSCQ